ncbi:flavodoxin domain-containing protein [Blastococcus sp. CT_GayMR16]|uniref:flavodoxin domain-containing protein n=1 Tax=Blastococcus sp. CT_GayMR16 TaxID=2559607 RepID=UPI0010730D17|nr:flavodoxin domain-containing protein [Blastococcus sp. CT_GayMR16]TFV86117.1 flavodoxin [Blastococcus sp. CT_GayMR16]
MTVLIAYASRAGATRGVAERIATRLRSFGLDVHLDPLLGREEVGRFQAVVLGSPIYSGEWETEAVDFLRRNAPALAGHALWTFSVGWVGRDGTTHDAKHLEEINRLAQAREHRFFVGALDSADLPLVQRLAFRMRGGRSGDFRDWAAIDAWTDEIARQLTASTSAR